MMNRNQENRTLWIGDIEPWMNEKTIEEIFNKFGRVMSVKLVRQKEGQHPSGYSFVEFETHAQADNIITKYSQKPIPGIQNTFRMNWSNNPPGMVPRSAMFPPAGGYPNNGGFPNNTGYPMNGGYGGYQNRYAGGMPAAAPHMYQQYPTPSPSIGVVNQEYQANPQQQYEVYVGELQQGVTEAMIVEHFKVRYGSVTGAKLVFDPITKVSKGYGFVKFSSTTESQRAITEMNGAIIKGKPIKVSPAAIRSQLPVMGAQTTYPQPPQQAKQYSAQYYPPAQQQQQYYSLPAGQGYDQTQNAAWYYQQQQQQYAQYYGSTASTVANGNGYSGNYKGTQYQQGQPQNLQQQVQQQIYTPTTPTTAITTKASTPTASQAQTPTSSYLSTQTPKTALAPLVEELASIIQPPIQSGLQSTFFGNLPPFFNQLKVPLSNNMSESSNLEQINGNVSGNKDSFEKVSESLDQQQQKLQQQEELIRKQQAVIQQQQLQLQLSRQVANLRDQELEFLEEDVERLFAVSHLQFSLNHPLS